MVGVLMRHEHMRDLDRLRLDQLEQRSLDPVRVDQHAVTALFVGDEVRVRRPLRMLRALDDHANSITLLIPSCCSISSNPLFTSSSVMRCEMNDSTSISPASQRSTSFGTPSRPFTPPNDEPAMRRPVIRYRGTTSSVSPFPATPATVQSPQPMRADSTAWRITPTLPVASKV